MDELEPLVPDPFWAGPGAAEQPKRTVALAQKRPEGRGFRGVYG